MYQLYCDDNLVIMPMLVENSIDAIVTDPPYGLKFMGEDWDHGVPGETFWREALRVAKPGCHLLAFGGTRTFHRLICAIEDAGWEIRDTIMWVYGGGFPKSYNLDNGLGTALKPAYEPITLARKPISEKTIASNVFKWGVGGININENRVGTERIVINGQGNDNNLHGNFSGVINNPERRGRFPANLIHDGSDEVVELFPEAGNGWKRNYGEENYRGRQYSGGSFGGGGYKGGSTYADSGSAARFFYCAKASKSDRESGNIHPTVKPTALMRYLCRLITPPNGMILDPFMGSGSTGKAALLEGFSFIGIDNKQEYVDIAKMRLEKIHIEE